MNSIRAILIEDEPSGMENLRYKLNKNCPEVEIIAECTDGKTAIQAIKRNLPDLIFLDIRLGDMSGFDVLKAIKHPTFETIFTTSYDEYAIEAIKNNALDYLLKPIDIDELMDAVAKARVKLGGQASTQSTAPTNTKMGFPIATGKLFIDLNEILYFSADDNVCILHLKEANKEIKLTKTLSWAEALLEEKEFCRVHHSYLINFTHMTEFIRNDGGYVLMSNGKAISVSRRRKDAFLEKLSQWQP
ncbi:MAG: LytR/AlgR family response regulator transcription factor [Bacteroidia bacterium]